MKLAQLLVLASACLLAATAAGAQWQWMDRNRQKVFSDTAPPPDIPDKNILRRPGPAPSARATFSPAPAAAPEAGAQAAAPTTAPRPAGSPKPAGVDKELEEKARKAEEAEKAKQAAEAQKVAQARPSTASAHAKARPTMDSGMRVARLNAQGEREIMDDKMRAAENQRLQSVIDGQLRVARGRASVPALPPLRRRAKSPVPLAPCCRKRSRRAILGSTVSGRHSSMRSSACTCCSHSTARPQMQGVRACSRAADSERGQAARLHRIAHRGAFGHAERLFEHLARGRRIRDRDLEHQLWP